MDGTTAEHLRNLSGCYASGVDRRDTQLFLAAFAGDATLTIETVDRAAEPAVLRGHDELALVVERIRRYDTTFHQLGQHTFAAVGDGAARGEVYCVAHHWRNKAGRREHKIMYIRYVDEYRRDGDNGWRIAARTVRIDATETTDGSAA
jgi:hypothetical protein